MQKQFKQIHSEFDDFNQQQTKIILQDLRNFPTLPDYKSLQGKNQKEILSKFYPWGCKQLKTFKLQTDEQYEICEITCKDFANICIGIKYGLCPFFNIKDLQFMIKKLRQKSENTNVYIRMQDYQHIYALARVQKIDPNITFKYWHVDKGKYYPLGVALIQVVAVGETKKQFVSNCQKDLKHLLNVMNLSQIQWIHFKVAEDYEWIERMKFINALKMKQYKKIIKVLESENRNLLEDLKQQ